MTGDGAPRTARPRRGRLRADVADVWSAMRGRTAPQVPVEDRSWLRRKASELYYSDRGRRVAGDTLDLVDRVRGRYDARIPPRRLQFVGRGDFIATGEEFRRHFIELGGLQPHHDVLDVGCGIGRMAIGLSGYLTGRYEGFDIVPEGVEWCRRNVTPRNPTFRFQLADIHNHHYNPGGRHAPEDYRFPFADESFDFAFLTSVFTHLMPPAVDNYLGELARVLRAGGTCFATYFLLNDETERLMEGTGQFQNDHGDHLTVDDDNPELAVAFPEDRARGWHERHDLPIERIHPGSWCGRDSHTSLQDITISRRR